MIARGIFEFGLLTILLANSLATASPINVESTGLDSTTDHQTEPEFVDSQVPKDDQQKLEESLDTSDPSDYISDLEDAISGKRALDPQKVYTVVADLPMGELLMLSTASGCALLSSPDDNLGQTPLEPIEFTFKISELEDCAKLTNSIISGLQEEIFRIIQAESRDSVTSTTTLSQVSERGKRQVIHTERVTESIGDDSSPSTSDLVQAFLAAHLKVNLLPTSLEGVFVTHFDISDEPQVASDKMIGDLKRFGEALKKITPPEIRNYESKLNREIQDGRKILDELSSSDVENVQCESLGLDKCGSVSKCDVVVLNGKKVCSVSPKTIFWLLQSNCALQSKAGLFSVARDLMSVGILSESAYNTLRESFNLDHICSTIVNSYLSANIGSTERKDTDAVFDL